MIFDDGNIKSLFCFTVVAGLGLVVNFCWQTIYNRYSRKLFIKLLFLPPNLTQDLSFSLQITQHSTVVKQVDFSFREGLPIFFFLQESLRRHLIVYGYWIITGWSPRLRGSSEPRISAPIWSVSSRSPRLVITSSIIPLGSGSAFWGIRLEGKNLSDYINFYLVLLTTLPSPPTPCLSLSSAALIKYVVLSSGQTSQIQLD